MRLMEQSPAADVWESSKMLQHLLLYALHSGDEHCYKTYTSFPLYIRAPSLQGLQSQSCISQPYLLLAA